MAEVEYTIRNMIQSDVPQALDIWRETGMQEGTHSLYSWMEVDPEGLKVAVTKEGEVIGFCAAVIHHEDLAFLGLYCVKEKYRGAGIGFKIWTSCMEHIGHRNACLYAEPDKVELYRNRGGFPIVQSKWVCFVNRRYSPVNADKLSGMPPEGINIVPFEEHHLSLMYDYDKKLMGYDRHLLIKLTCREQDSRVYLAVKMSECVGFGIIKMSCQDIALIGPLYADKKEVAEVLLKKLILSFPEAKGLAIMSLSCNDAANELIQSIGFPENPHECPVLYRQKAVDISDRSKVYAIFGCNISPY